MWWKWLQLDHMQIICTLLQTDNHTNTSSLNFYRPDALPYAQPTVSKHWRHKRCTQNAQSKHSAVTDKDIVMRLRQNKAWKFETEPRQDDKTYKCRDWAKTKTWKTKMSRDKTLLETTWVETVSTVWWYVRCFCQFEKIVESSDKDGRCEDITSTDSSQQSDSGIPAVFICYLLFFIQFKININK